MISTVTPPMLEPIDLIGLDLARLQIRADDPVEDALIAQYVASAWNYVERASWRQLLTATLKLTVPRFPAGRTPLPMPRGPFQSLTAIAYTDPNGDVQTLNVTTDVQILGDCEPAELLPAVGTTWPATQSGNVTAVEITFVAGYGETIDTIPAMLIHAVLVLLNEFYEFREPREKCIDAVDALIEQDALHDDRLTALV